MLNFRAVSIFLIEIWNGNIRSMLKKHQQTLPKYQGWVGGWFWWWWLMLEISKHEKIQNSTKTWQKRRFFLSPSPETLHPQKMGGHPSFREEKASSIPWDLGFQKKLHLSYKVGHY